MIGRDFIGSSCMNSSSMSHHAEVYRDLGDPSPMFHDSPIAERQNKPIKQMQVAAAHMNQTTWIWRQLHMFSHRNETAARGGELGGFPGLD